ncbi:hypothetical protein Rs2_45622 [Raphanus sativus]|nr:hypothetical protein Rs2_45622 [Raphanus sativus]
MLQRYIVPERSKAAWQIIQDYLMPFVERERYQIQSTCRLHPDNDLYRDQEQHKVHVDVYEWKCGYCRKSFNEEKFLDQHFATRHHILLNTGHKITASVIICFTSSESSGRLIGGTCYIKTLRRGESTSATNEVVLKDHLAKGFDKMRGILFFLYQSNAE